MNSGQKITKNTKLLYAVQDMGSLLIIGISLVYALYRQRVAERFIQLPFLDFPIFIGEIVLAVCFGLLVCKLFLEYRSGTLRINRWTWGTFALYAVWVVYSALTGYFKIGAFAFRTAALFYYILFGVMAFHFYRREFYSKNTATILVFGMLCFAAMNAVTLYYRIPFFLILLFLLFSLENTRIRYVGLAVMVLSIFSGISWETSIHRSHLAGVLGTLVFLFVFGLRYISKNNLLGKRLLIGFFIVSILSVFVFLDNNVRKSFAIKTMVEEYDHFNGYIQRNKHLFIFRDVPPNLYQDDAVKYGRRPITPEERSMRDDPFPDRAMVWPDGKPGRPRPQNISRFETEQEEQAEGLAALVPKQQGRNIYQSRNQILFRIFIWRDMLNDMTENPFNFINGVGFHKPQRSHSIEILGWGRQEWGRDGWIAPHNSFFNILYRGGILGLVLIVGLVYLTIRIAVDFGNRRLLHGGFLVGALVYWLVISNFLVYLEVPHTAIPFWAYVGVLCAYWRDFVNEHPSHP